MAEEAAVQTSPPPGRWVVAAAAGLGLVAVVAIAVAIAFLRGPLSTESLTRAMRVPGSVLGVFAVAAVVPHLVLVFREPLPAERWRGWLGRAVAVLGAGFALGIGSALGSAMPRFAFDDWERRLSATSGGVPWLAAVSILLAAAFAASLALGVHRLLRAKGARRSRQATTAVGVAAALIFAYAASAAVFLATGTRLVPVGAIDDPYAPVEGQPCPAR